MYFISFKLIKNYKTILSFGIEKVIKTTNQSLFFDLNLRVDRYNETYFLIGSFYLFVIVFKTVKKIKIRRINEV